MIFGKIWGAFRAQVNKLANFFWTADYYARIAETADQVVLMTAGIPALLKPATEFRVQF